jgi:hypothetical protein
VDSRRVNARYSPVQKGPAKRAARVLASASIDGAPVDATQVGLGRAVAVDVDAGTGAGQPTLGSGQLDSSDHLLLGGVPAKPGLRGCSPGGLGELLDPGRELGNGALERVEAHSLDASLGPGGERPGGYLRWSIGT